MAPTFTIGSKILIRKYAITASFATSLWGLQWLVLIQESNQFWKPHLRLNAEDAMGFSSELAIYLGFTVIETNGREAGAAEFDYYGGKIVATEDLNAKQVLQTSEPPKQALTSVERKIEELQPLRLTLLEDLNPTASWQWLYYYCGEPCSKAFTGFFSLCFHQYLDFICIIGLVVALVLTGQE
jgi:hypothetical protein